MKNWYFFWILLIGFTGYSQSINQLKELYVFDFGQIRSGDGKEVFITKFSNPELFREFRKADENNDRAYLKENVEKWSEAYAQERVTLEKGKYHLTNFFQQAEFEIGSNGQLVGEATIIWRKGQNTIESTYTFSKEGELQKIVNEGGTGFRVVGIVKDDLLTFEKFENNHTIEKNAIRFKENTNEIIERIYYYTNGNIKFKNNYLNRTEESFYPNGNIERWSSENETKSYNEEGQLVKHDYKSDEWNCNESYQNGLIIEKSCYNFKSGDSREEYYTNGQLDYVLEDIDGVTRKYDKNGKFIKEEKTGYLKVSN